MTPIERARAHFTSIPVKRIEIPEWGGPDAPLVITFRQLTPRDRQKIYQLDSGGRSPDGATVQVRAVLFQARDEAGKLLFDPMDEKVLLYECDSSVVARIALAVLHDAGLVNRAGKPTSFDEQKDEEKNV